MCRAHIIRIVANYVFIVMNSILTLAAIVLMGFGIVLFAHMYNFLELVPYNPRLIAILSIVFGAVASFVTSFGFVGATKEMTRMMFGYVIFMFALAAVKIWMAAEIFMGLDDIHIIVRTVLDSAFFNPELSESFPALEVALRCCGTTGGASYHNLGLPTPASCCSLPVDDTCDGLLFGTEGCNTAMSTLLERFGQFIGITAATLAGVELVVAVSGIVLIFYFTQNLRANSEPSGVVSLMRK